MSLRYLFELGVEEIPARFMPLFLEELKSNATQVFNDHRLEFSELKVYGTYRRLVFLVSGLPQKQEDYSQILNGPPVRISVSEKGEFLPPAIGFAKRVGVDVKELVRKTENGQEVLSVTQLEKGKTTKELIPTIIGQILSKFSLPISMRWADHSGVFFRPVHWMVSLLNDVVIPVKFFDITASNETYGHRFLTNNNSEIENASGEKVKVNSIDDYFKTLEKLSVVLDQEKRKASIRNSLLTEIADIDQELLDEVVYLVESPKVLEGKFDTSYLDVPAQALVQCMKKNQKYFPVYKNNKLSNRFLFAADNVTKKNEQNIINGNESVLRARLEDVKFFWNEDLKIPLDMNVKKLEKVVYQKGLGSIADKVYRLQKIASKIQSLSSFSVNKADLKRAVTLCKADLVSQMVFELPELQGVMGSLYAEKQGEKKEVSKAIEEHYLPKFSGDKLPNSDVGIVVSLADKFDLIVTSFYNDLKPTGSKDPWGVRRAIYSILSIIFEKEKDQEFNISDIIDTTYDLLDKNHKNKDELIQFFKQRLRGYFIDNGFAHDIVDSVIDLAMKNVGYALDKAINLVNYKDSDQDSFKQMVETAVRVNRLSKKVEKKSIDTELFTDLESETFKVVNEIKGKNGTLTLKDLSSLTDPMNTYFDTILVMDKDEKIKHNRLAFLHLVDLLFSQFCDFEKLITK